MNALKRIALVGLPGSGKSSVAPLLARRLGWRCVDTDATVELERGVPVQVIFAHEGEDAFRAAELQALQTSLAVPEPSVVACGGGLMAQEEARRMLLDGACVVWLDAPDDVLLTRVVAGAERPLLAPDPARRLAQLRSQRNSAYSRSHLRISTAGVSPEAVAERLASALGGSVPVPVPGRAYHVAVGAGTVADVSLHLPPAATRAAIVADSAVAPLAAALRDTLLDAGLDVALLPLSGGEGVKTWEQAGRLHTALSELGLERKDCLVAIGGGTVGDLAGFVAATYLRGIAWINVPTTLLAMVDSAIGGKTGVNLPRGKNLAGAIWQPRAVICDTDVLATLPQRAFRSAFAEIVKYAMIVEDGCYPALRRLDVELDPLLRKDTSALPAIVRECVAVKGEVVASDERESGLRAVLNYGHTVGHALETLTGFGDALWHGEAIAVGMRVAGLLSVRQLGCPQDHIEWQNELLERCDLRSLPAVPPERVMELLPSDKKASGGRVGWVLLEARGRPRVAQPVPDALVRETLKEALPANAR